MVYGYVRVSTDKQDNASQRFEIENFCKRENIAVDNWIEEVISGAKCPNKRKLGTVIAAVNPGDLIITGEISRLGRSLYMVMNIMKQLLERDVKVWTIKDGYRLDESLQSKVLAFAFGLAAEIERELISKRTKEGLARKRAEGVRLGKPPGSKNLNPKLKGKEDIIKDMIIAGNPQTIIQRELGVCRGTLTAKLREMNFNPRLYKKRITYAKPRVSVYTKRFDTISTLFGGGMTIAEVSRILGIPYMSLKRYALRRKILMPGESKPKWHCVEGRTYRKAG